MIPRGYVLYEHRLNVQCSHVLKNGASLNANSPSNTYVTATIFSLAHPYGTPTILSSYSGFTDTDLGAPNGGKKQPTQLYNPLSRVVLLFYVGAGTCSGTGGENGWLCQHRWVAFSGMTGFHNNVGSAAITNWVSPQSDRIAFGRGLHFLFERYAASPHI